MPEKPAFDPKKHLLNPKDREEAAKRASEPVEADDEAMARALQEQLNREQSHQGDQHQDHDADWEYAKQVQMASQSGGLADFSGIPEADGDLDEIKRMQEEALWDIHTRRSLLESQEEATTQAAGQANNYEANLAARHRESGAVDQLEFAKRQQEQALWDIKKQNEKNIPNKDQESTRGDSDLEVALRLHLEEEGKEPTLGDTDLEMALRMQHLEHKGLGRFNSEQRTHGGSLAATEAEKRLSEQEEEDARLARIMMETGKSFRDLDMQSFPTDESPSGPVVAPSTVEAYPSSSGARPSQPSDNRPNRPPKPPAVSTYPPSSGARPSQPSDSRPNPSPKPPPASTYPPSSGARPSQPSDSRPNRISSNIVSDPNRALPHENMDLGPQAQQQKGGSSKNKSSVPKDKASPLSGLLGLVKKPPKERQLPEPVPRAPLKAKKGPLPHSESVVRNPGALVAPSAVDSKKKGLMPARHTCTVCKKSDGKFIKALDKKYHKECFRCVGCHLQIDSKKSFAYMTGDDGEKHPLHSKCYAEIYGVKCAVCRESIPPGPDGRVSYVKHPFFDTEQMCPRHANEPGRRCTGCHRFEPVDAPFADLNDGGRVVCFSCCRTVIVDGDDAQPLWERVLGFLEHVLNLPIWQDMRTVPIIVVGHDALNEQMMATGAAHSGTNQLTTRGLCLTEHQSGRRLKISKMKFDQGSSSFQLRTAEDKGFTYFQVPDASKNNPDASVTCILCLSGLPSDLTASVLAHEATHAWIKLHPQYDFLHPIPQQVEEGVAQLVAMLFLSQGLNEASTETFGDSGPSEAKLRQYFRFSIETDDHAIYGEGYRKAAAAYANIGIEALLSHIVLYQEFPKT